MDTIIFTLGKGIFVSLLAVFVEKILIKLGFTRGNTVWLIVGAFLIIFLAQLLDSSGPFWLYCLFIVIIGPISVNRIDIMTTLRKGKRWWISEN